MSSYCEVCRGLFDMPHDHGRPYGCSRQNTPRTFCETIFSPRVTVSSPPPYMSSRKSGSCRSSPASIHGLRGSRSQQRQPSVHCRLSASSSWPLPIAVKERAASQRRTPSRPMTASAERDTVCSLVRMNSSVQGTALVNTPKRSGETLSTPRRVRSGRCVVTPPSGRDVRSSGSGSGSGNVAGTRVTPRLDNLQKTLERIREAVRRDNAATVDIGEGAAMGRQPAAVRIDSGEEYLAGLWQQENSGSIDDTAAQQGLYGSVGDIAGEVPFVDHRSSFPLQRSEGFSNLRSPPSPLAAGSAYGVTESPTDFRQGISPLMPSSSSHDKSSRSQQEIPSIALPASCPEHSKETSATVHSVKTHSLELQTSTLPKGELPHPSLGCGEGGQGRATLAHLEALRAGFVELCSAVREDLHALHARVSELQKQQQEQQEQHHQQLQQIISGGVSCKQTGKSLDQNGTTVMPPFMSYDMMLAELQQYTVSTVHKVFQQQQQQKMEHISSPHGAVPVVSEPPPFFSSASPLFSTRGSSPTPGIYGLSPETFDAHVRSTVRAILYEENFKRETEVVTAEQRVRERGSKAWRREWKRRCVELEEQLTALAETVESTRIDVEELRLRPPPPPPPPSSSTTAQERHSTTLPSISHPRLAMSGRNGAESLVPPYTANAVNATPKVWEDRLMQRVQRLLADSEERCLQCARGEIMQPVLEHVRRLMSVHQSMIDTVVESRCAQFEAYVDRSRHGWELQVAELRSRVSSLRGDVHRALMDLSANLNVACPGL